MARTGGAARYFFAVWPDAAVRDRLGEWAESIHAGPSSRRVPAVNLHMTVVFLGTLEPAQVEAVRGMASGAPWSGASLELNRIGYWKRSRIIWAGSREGSASLSALAEDLRGRLRRRGFRVEDRPFVPHVTLYRNAHRRPRWRQRVVTWPVNEFCLVASRLSSGGARYDVVDRWSANSDVK